MCLDLNKPSDRVDDLPYLDPSKELDCVCCLQVQAHRVLVSQTSVQSICMRQFRVQAERIHIMLFFRIFWNNTEQNRSKTRTKQSVKLPGTCRLK